jgi:hypothetical protein
MLDGDGVVGGLVVAGPLCHDGALCLLAVIRLLGPASITKVGKWVAAQRGGLGSRPVSPSFFFSTRILMPCQASADTALLQIHPYKEKMPRKSAE